MKAKTLIASALAGSALFASSVLFADAYSASVSTDKSWTSAGWTPSEGLVNGYPVKGSAITISGANNKTLKYDVTDADYSVSSFAYGSGVSIFYFHLNSSFKVAGDFERTNGGTGSLVIRGASSTFHVTGDLNSTASASSDFSKARLCLGHSTNANPALEKFIVDGNATFTSSHLMGYVINGITIGGYLDMQAGTNNYTSSAFLNYYVSSETTTSAKIGAIKGGNGSAGKGGIYASNGASNKSTVHLTLTGVSGSEPFVYNGAVADSSVSNDTGGLHVIMAASSASFTQVFAGTKTYSGNTILTKGTLQLTTTASATTNIGDVYLGYDTSTIRNDTTGVVDMDLLSGKGMTNAQTSIVFDGVGATVKSLNWSSGKLGMVLSDLAKDSAVFSIASGGELVLGSADYFTFDFSGVVNQGETYILISTTSNLSAFIDKFKSNYGNGAAHFKYENGALLFTAGALIPEPGTYALIFGALALAFVAYKRRK